MNLIGEYIKYKLSNKGKHDIHSPFVYNFVSKCLKEEIRVQDSNILDKYKKALKTNKSKVLIRDFGAGSKKLGLERKISAIYANVSSKGVYANLLYQLNKHYQFERCLEFGISLGVGTLNLALGNEKSEIITVEACENTFNFTKNEFEKMGINNVLFQRNTFYDFIVNLKRGETKKFDLIFIDGHHDGEALLFYLKELEPFSHPETLFILDDIRWSDGMFKAWNKIIKDEKFHLTMDLFRMGIISKRPMQAKEHFVVKLKGILKGMI
jgi:predicted O-methyltransferase YrrM